MAGVSVAQGTAHTIARVGGTGRSYAYIKPLVTEYTGESYRATSATGTRDNLVESHSGYAIVADTTFPVQYKDATYSQKLPTVSGTSPYTAPKHIEAWERYSISAN